MLRCLLLVWAVSSAATQATTQETARAVEPDPPQEPARAASTEPQDPLQQPTLPYDPFRGMDHDGRIPKPAFPTDLQRPERWRYTPPARIKPGGVLDRFWVSSFVTPIIFREADIGVGGGFALTDIDFLNDNFRQFANITCTYSAEGQQTYRINWSRWLGHRPMPDGGVIREERGRLYARGGYSKTLTRRFFGFGDRKQTPTLNPQAGAVQTSYTEELTDLGFGVRLPLPDDGGDWLLRLDLAAERHQLAPGRVSSLPSTDTVFGSTFQSGDGVDQLWLLTQFAWDTRDSQIQPYSGKRLGVTANTAWQTNGQLGAVVSVDAQHIFELPPLLHRGAHGREENPPTDVLAFGGFVQDTYGDLPFYSLPTLGGTHTLRGYIQNRFTDRAVAHFSTEYRLGLIARGFAFTDTIRIERIGVAFFYDCGTVASDADKLFDGRFLQSYGVGLRLAFAREALFRVDYGISDEGGNFTIAFGNTF
ncbi:MAG: BamA/TamA family outer membrane protein [Planctomycetes bacterium]|nr:BamA/TamA family outer membrane protein [Planctomycetota bacterium]